MDRRFIIPDNLNLLGVKAVFTTRSNGERNHPLKGFNLSFTDETKREEVIKNRSAVAS